MTSICLNMIVKNESDVIIETLENILAHIQIDYWVISDTGSTDDTVQLIEKFFKQKRIEGKIHHDQWVDFSHNRNLALDHCVGKSDYIFISDADDRIYGDLILPELIADAYDIRMRSAERDFYFFKKLLIKNNQFFHWVGVLHEGLITTKPNVSKVMIDGDYFVKVGHFGNRSKDPTKYLKDALLLEKNIPLEQDHNLKSRYMFYCACSYHDARMHEKSIEWFKQRKQIKLAEFDEEQWLSFLHLGMQYEVLKDYANATYYWLQGFDYYPNRAECLYHCIRIWNDQDHNRLALEMIGIAKKIPMPMHGESIEKNVYLYGLNYESARANIELKNYNVALIELIHLLQQPTHSKSLSEFIVNGLSLCLEQNLNINVQDVDETLIKLDQFNHSFQIENIDVLKQQILRI